ncbi:MAG: glycosyl hydrolase, partial [Candidatus Eremiobacteraeota bacterium]|nr:glycosyl hydrolase [Candidatus Eremiobacteraeota bacterium]
MSRRSRRRSPRGILILVALAAIAVVAGCSLLRPAHHTASHGATAESSPEPIILAPTPATLGSAAPIASPSKSP